MKDTISNRIRRIITGTAHSIVTKIEGLAPGTILEQAIDEVDGALDEVKVELGRITAQKHHVTKTISRINDEHHELASQLEFAQKEGRKDLIEAAFSRQIDLEDQLPTLENQLIDLDGQEKELNAAIAGLLAKRNEMEDELFHFTQSQKSQGLSSSGDGLAGPRSSPVAAAERAERAFGRVLENATGVRRGTLRSGSAESGKLIELAKISKEARIAARMRELEGKS